jgi:TonB family protein
MRGLISGAVAGWGVALACAAGLHFGAAYAVFAVATPEAEPGGSPIAIEIESPPAAQASERADLPVGPPAPEIAPAAAAAPSVDVPPPKPEDLTQAPVTEREDAPLRAAEKPPEKPEPTPPETPPTPKVETTAAAAPASEAMAAPKLDVPPADQPSAPEGIGSAPIDEAAKRTWIKALVAHLDRHKRFPAGRKGSQGTFEVTLRFDVEPSGKLRASSVIKSSGDAAFDAAALQMMARADPLPVPPRDLIARDGGRFDVPIVFRARN